MPTVAAHDTAGRSGYRDICMTSATAQLKL